MTSKSNLVLLTLQSIYVRLIGEHIMAVGGDLEGWLGKCELRVEHLGQELISIQSSAFTALVVDSIVLTKEPALGLLVGDRFKVNTHGLLGFAAINGRTLHQVMELLVRYVALRTSLVTLAIEEVNDEVRLVIRESMQLGDARIPVLEAVLLALKNILDFGRGAHGAVRRVYFAWHRVAYEKMVSEIVRCDISWATSWTGLSIPAELARKELRAADTTAYEQAEKLCASELERLAHGNTMTATIQKLLLNATFDPPSLTIIARQLHLTNRTLHRRLIEEGTSFSRIVDELRRNLALEHLRGTSMSVQDIAWVLGYSDEANFRRAFRRWKGVSPRVWRSEQKSLLKP
jgi:AraC-like DNA-binding protein